MRKATVRDMQDTQKPQPRTSMRGAQELILGPVRVEVPVGNPRSVSGSQLERETLGAGIWKSEALSWTLGFRNGLCRLQTQ